MPRIFISYRRSDSQMVAGRMRESLARRLGEEAIFRDKDSIGAGENWMRAIEAGLSKDTVVLALIGPNWVTARDEAGHRRLDDPADWNRVELELALKRSARIIPLLIDETRMPPELELPGELRQLCSLNALRLRDDDWSSDVERLILAIRRRRQWTWTSLSVALAIGMACTATIGYWWWKHPEAPPGQTAPSKQLEAPPKPPASSSFLDDIRENLRAEQERGLRLLLGADPAEGINLINANLAHIDTALQSFPKDTYLKILAGYAAKNVYAAGRELLAPDQRKRYLAQARAHFEAVLQADPNDPSALNGMGNVLFYERRFDDAIRHHQQAIKLAGGSYPAAEHDLDLVRRVKSGAVPFPE